MRYKLHLQWKNLSLDDLVEIEERLIEGLSKAEVNGHEIGRDEADIFISTDAPPDTFEEVKTILMSHGHWDDVRAAFRETSEDEYTVLWPQGEAAAHRQHVVPTYFPVNTFSFGAQCGGHIPREVSHEEQRMRDAFNLWQGKYTSAVGKFAFLLRVDGSMLRYTELFKIKGAQEAKLKKGWVEVEIGVPQSWWHNDNVEGYKKHLARAVEEGLHSMVELLRKKRHEVDAEALLCDWEKIKHDFLSGTSD